jgi:hypothetical protein
VKLKPIYGLVIFSLLIAGCEKIYEEPSDSVKDGIEAIEQLNSSISLLPVIEHINSRFAQEGMDLLVKQKLETELNAEINWIDSVFGNNEEVTLELKLNGNNRVFSNDYFGEMEIIVKRNYMELGSEVLVKISNTNPLTIENENNVSHTLEGSIKIERTITNAIKVDLDGLTMVSESDKYQWGGSITYNWVSGENIPGVINDIIHVSGNGSCKDEDELEFTWDITTPLSWNLEPACTRYFTTGILLIKDDDRYNINFDPFENGACNDIVKITKAGKSYEINLSD